jgi:TP901 family phage tail tape measure protein
VLCIMGEVRSQANVYVNTGNAVDAYNNLINAQDKAQKSLDNLRAKEKKLTDEISQELAKQQKLRETGFTKEANALKKSTAEKQKALIETSAALKKTETAFDANVKQVERLEQKISGRLSPSAKDLTNTIAKLRRELNSMSEEDAGFDTKRQQLAQAQAQLQQYNAGITGLKNRFMELASTAKGVAFGVMVGGLAQSAIASVGSAITGGFNARSEFQGKVQNLSAITGASGQDLEFLRAKAIELSTTSSKSASDFVEAMKFIASAKPELLSAKEDLAEVTRQADRLSKASGLDLPDASKRLTDALNQFGAPASDASKYVDALAAAAKYGAAEVPEITESLVQFGATAKASNIDIYESAAAIEVMAEKGIKGAEAGTKLRNVFLAMSAADVLDAKALKSLKDADVDINKLKDTSLSLEERLAELGKIGGNTSAIVNVFGKENAVAAQVVLQNIPRYAELNTQIREQGAAQAQAAANTGTLSSAWGKLKNTVTALFLSFDLTPLTNMVTALRNGVEWFGRMTGAIKSNSQLLGEEQYQLKLTETNIQGLAVGTAERTRMLDELKTRYPELLKNLDSERAGNEEVRAAIESVNNMLIQKIALASKEEELTDQLTAQGEATAALTQNRIQIGKELTTILNQNGFATNQWNKEQLDGLDVMQQTGALLSGAIKLQGVSSVSLAGLQKAYDAYRSSLANNNEEQDKSNKLLAEKAEFEKQLRGILGMPEAAPTGNAPTINPDAPSAAGGDNNAAKQYENSYKAAMHAAELANQQMLLATKKNYADGLINAASYHDSLKFMELDMLNAKIIIAQTYVGKVKGVEDELLDLKNERENKSLDLQISANKEEEELLKMRLEMESALNDELNNAGEEQLRETLRRINDERAARAAAAAERQQSFQQEMQKANEGIQTYGGAVTQIMSSAFQVATNLEQQELQRFKATTDSKKAELKRQLDSKLISERTYNQKLAALDEAYRQKERQAKKNQFEREKAASIINAVIGTALAVTNALSSSVPPVSYALAAIAGALGAAQIAVIASQPTPEFEKGGILEGPSHKMGGITITKNGVPYAEAEGGEMILSRAFVENNQEYRNPLLAASRDGGRLIDYLPAFAPVPGRVNLGRALENVAFERGGIMPNSSSDRAASTATAAGAAPREANSNANTALLYEISETLKRIESNTEIDYYKLARSMEEINEIVQLQL